MNRWVVLAASFLAQAMQYGIVWTVGMFNMMFLEAFHEKRGATALISSLNTAVFFLTGPLSGALVNRCGHRLTAFGGGLIGALGIMFSSFATSITYLYVSFGFLAGIGLGVSCVPTLAIIGLHFKDKQQSFAFAVSMSGVGIGMVIFPFIVQFFADTYGWRGATLITGGIILNICVVGLLMKAPTSGQPSTKKSKGTSTGIFNLKVFMNINFCLFLLSNAFFFGGHSIISVHYPSHALSLGMEQHRATYLVSIMGLANFAGRILGGMLALTNRITSMNIYVTSMLLCTVATVCCPLAHSYLMIAAYAAAFGMLVGCFCVKLPSVIIQILDVELLASGYGYMLLFEAMGTLLGAPMAGWLFDQTQDYTVSFILAGACMFIAALAMLPPWIQTAQCCTAHTPTINRTLDDKVIVNDTMGSLECQETKPMNENHEVINTDKMTEIV